MHNRELEEKRGDRVRLSMERRFRGRPSNLVVWNAASTPSEVDPCGVGAASRK